MASATPESTLDTAGMVDEVPATDTGDVIPSSAEAFPDPLAPTPEQNDVAEEGESLLGDEGKTVQAEASESAESADPQAEKAGASDFADLRVPDSYDVKDEALAQFKEVAKTAGLSVEQAQAFLDADLKRAEAGNQAYQAHVEAQNKEWSEQSSKDPEIGGVDFESNLHEARKFLKSYNDPEMIGMLNKTGLGNHPSFIKLFVRMAKASAEDSTSVLTQPGRRELSVEERLVPELVDL